jgi:hypothetical protein
MLVDARPAEMREVETIAARQHCFGEGGRLRAIEAAEITRHEQRGHLIVRHMTLRVRQGERTPLARLDATTVALALDQAMGKHRDAREVD